MKSSLTSRSFGSRAALLTVAAAAFLSLLASPSTATQEPDPARQPAASERPAAAQPPDEERPTVQVPPFDPGALSLPRRAKDQREALAASRVFAGFELRDRREETGIGFRHGIVDDAGLEYKMIHYDHGTGVAAADVDGDDRVDLYFVNQVGGNELWRNTGDGRFEEITDQAGVGLADRVSVAAAFADADNDGDPDLYVTTVKMGNALFENLGGGKFREVTAEAGLAHTGHSSGALWLDYNRDGLLDLLVTNVGVYTTDERGRAGYFVGVLDAFSGHKFPERSEPTLLYENRGGLRFAEVSAERGLVDLGWTGDAAFADFDRDGYPELYLLNMQGDDRLWHNVEGRRFVDRTAEWIGWTPWGAMGIEVLDFDNDGLLDIYVTDMHSDMGREILYDEERRKSEKVWSEEDLQGGDDNLFGNALYRQLPAEGGEVRFEEVSDRLGVEVYWPWGTSAGDLNADGWTDLFVTASMNYPFRYQPNSVLLNEEGSRFLDAAFVLGAEPRAGGATHTPWFDADCSGAKQQEPYCRGRSGSVTVMATLGSRSSLILDLDGDGDLDVVTNEFNSPPQVLVSDLSERRAVRHLEIELRGSLSNRDGLGALVRVHAGGRVLTFQEDGKSGYLAQSSLPLYVGLGEAAAAEKIEVLWPSGTEQVVPGPIAAGERIEIVEPGEAAQPAAAATAPPAAAPAPQASAPPPARLPLIATPTEDPGAESLPRRAADQRAAAAASGVFSGFELRDRLEESGIAFRHLIVDDAGRHYKAVHYDHGNGLAVADVDGDLDLDLYFTSQMGGNQLWVNVGGGRFEDATAEAGVGLADRVSVAAAFGDADNDGDPDLFVTTVKMGNVLFENMGGSRFRDVTEAAGVGFVGHSSGALWLDYNRDGLLDLLVTNVGAYTTEERGRGGYFVGVTDAFLGHLHPDRAERTLLYENRGGLRFAEVSEERGLVDLGWTGDAAFTDLDRDGYPEVYLLNMQGDDHFWDNEGGRRFEEEAARRFGDSPWGAMGIVVLDYDNDGLLDFYLTDMHSDMSKQVDYEEERAKSDMTWSEEDLQGGENNLFGNALYHNLGPTGEGGEVVFEEVSDRLGVEVYWPWGASTADLNADGWADLFVTASMNFPFRYQPNSVFLNEGGRRFVDLAFVLGAEPRPGSVTQVPWFDVDCSGAEREKTYCQGRSGPHTLTATPGSRSSVVFDLEGDGDLDVVTNELNTPPQVLVSDLAERRPVRWLAIELRGSRSNRDGLGALVRVHSGGRVQTFQNDGKSGYLAQSSMPLYAGLGDAEAAEKIEVLWPSGVEQVVPGPIAAGRRIEVVEPAAEGGAGAGGAAS